MDPLTKRQSELEASAVKEGVRHFRRLLRSRRVAKSKPGLAFLRQNIESLLCAIREEQETICHGKSALHERTLLLCLSPEKLALITLQTALNMGIWEEPPSVQDVATKIGERCFRQWNYERQQRQKKRLRQLELEGRTKVEGQLSKIYRQLLTRHVDPQGTKAQNRAADLVNKLESDWTKDERAVLLGSILLDFAQKRSKIVEVANVTRVSCSGLGGDEPEYRTRKILQLTDETHHWLLKLQYRYEQIATPIHLPMIRTPIAWTCPTDGGYLSNRDKTLFDIHLVKHHNNPSILKTVEGNDLTVPLSAVNALQETAWRINECIYKLLREAWRKKIQLPGLPERDRLQLPDPPDNDSEEAIKEYRRASYEVRRMNAQITAKLTNFHLCMRGCRKLIRIGREIGDKRFYFPYQLDWRGRVYPIPQALHPQADDTGRALLEFADGKPLGEGGEFWLAVHLANMAGKDKLPFTGREQWVREHENDIHSFVENPLDPKHPFWWEADKPADTPWCLLAACMEWVNRDKPGFQSHIPIMVDGTCNGLQHLSAMGKDPEGGRWTNLLPSDRPQDIYQKVADQVVPLVKADAHNGKLEAKFWLEERTSGIDRKVVKQPTMTTPYGVKRPRGIEDQLTDLQIDEEKKLCKAEGRQFSREYFNIARQRAKYLAPIVGECIGKVVVEATSIMDWLKEVARLLANADRGVHWITPAGFPVVLEHRNPKSRRITTRCGKLTVYEQNQATGWEKNELDKNEQLKIAPHFIHSMDAAHLMLTVVRLRQEGVCHFHVIHDSYGVHACYVDHLNRVLREEFVKMYTEDILARFRDEQCKRNPGINLPSPPLPGSLYIREVLKSAYFFA